MTVVSYEPWRFVNRFHRDLEQIFGDAFSAPAAGSAADVAWIPSVDVHEEADRFVVRADLPGVEAKDIEITAEKGVLTLRGERRAGAREAGKGYERVERTAGTFLRRFTLPETAQTDAIKATHINGVLEIGIPKQPQVQPKRIEVQAA